MKIKSPYGPHSSYILTRIYSCKTDELLAQIDITLREYRKYLKMSKMAGGCKACVLSADTSEELSYCGVADYHYIYIVEVSLNDLKEKE